MHFWLADGSVGRDGFVGRKHVFRSEDLTLIPEPTREKLLLRVVLKSLHRSCNACVPALIHIYTGKVEL